MKRLDALVTGFVVTLAALFVIGPAANREMSLDDIAHLNQFPSENRTRNTLQIARLRHWQNQDDDALWRPVPKLFWAALYRAGLGGPRALSCVTALLAGCCAAALCQCWRKIGGGSPLMVLGAAAPILHPLSADVLLPFVGQSDLIAACGVLWAFSLLSYQGYLSTIGTGIFLVLAFLSKESSWPAVAVLPLVLWFGVGGQLVRRRNAVRAFCLAAGILSVVLVMRYAMFGNFASTAGAAGGAAMAAGERLVGPLEIVGRYASAIVLPIIPQTDYSFLKQPGSTQGHFPIFGISALVIIGAMAIACGRRTPATRANASILRARRRVLGSICWSSIFLLPYIGLIPLGALWAGRFAFLSLFGVPILFLSIAEAVWPKLRLGVAAYFLIVVLWGLSGIYKRAKDWVSPSALWEAEIRREPDHAFAWKNHAVYLQRDRRMDEALAAVKTSTKLWPTFGEAWLTQGQIAWAGGKIPEAEFAFMRAEELIPANSALELAQAQFAESQGKLDEAERRLRKVLSHDSTNGEGAKSLERVRGKRH